MNANDGTSRRERLRGGAPRSTRRGRAPRSVLLGAVVTLCLMCAAAGQVDAATIDIAIDTPSEPISVGDRIPVSIRFHLPPDWAFGGLETIDPGRLELLDQRDEVVPDDDGGTELSVEQTWVSYRAGHHVIEAFELQLMRPDGSTDRLRIPGPEVSVVSLIANEQDPALRPEKGGVAVRYRDYTLAWVAGIGGAFIVMGLLILVLARNRPRVVVEPPPPPPRPPHEVALEKLDAIRDEDLIGKGEVMAFYVRASEAVREYLGARYGFEGLEMTTGEILRALSGVRWPAGANERLVGQFLTECDLVKFAKVTPEMTEEEGTLETAYRIVTATIPPVEEHAIAEDEP